MQRSKARQVRCQQPVSEMTDARVAGVHEPEAKALMIER